MKQTAHRSWPLPPIERPDKNSPAWKSLVTPENRRGNFQKLCKRRSTHEFRVVNDKIDRSICQLDAFEDLVSISFRSGSREASTETSASWKIQRASWRRRRKRRTIFMEPSRGEKCTENRRERRSPVERNRKEKRWSAQKVTSTISCLTYLNNVGWRHRQENKLEPTGHGQSFDKSFISV